MTDDLALIEPQVLTTKWLVGQLHQINQANNDLITSLKEELAESRLRFDKSELAEERDKIQPENGKH